VVGSEGMVDMPYEDCRMAVGELQESSRMAAEEDFNSPDFNRFCINISTRLQPIFIPAFMQLCDKKNTKIYQFFYGPQFSYLEAL